MYQEADHLETEAVKAEMLETHEPRLDPVDATFNACPHAGREATLPSHYGTQKPASLPS